MPAKINIGGVKHEISDMRFNVNGSSKDVTKVLLNVGGAKKEIFSSKFIYDGQIVSRRPIPAGNVMYGYGNGQGGSDPVVFFPMGPKLNMSWVRMFLIITVR